ncbi:MAG: hypothetical protein LBV39_01425, partial [Bacteroidales bacterium]|nr:hypothetical protein [Bacteroidales bacterium]
MMYSVNKLWQTVCMLFVFTFAVGAQHFDLQSPIPVDSAVTIKQLDNGLRYYLRYNAKPEKRVEFRLAVKA